MTKAAAVGLCAAIAAAAVAVALYEIRRPPPAPETDEDEALDEEDAGVWNDAATE